MLSKKINLLSVLLLILLLSNNFNSKISKRKMSNSLSLIDKSESNSEKISENSMENSSEEGSNPCSISYEHYKTKGQIILKHNGKYDNWCEFELERYFKLWWSHYKTQGWSRWTETETSRRWNTDKYILKSNEQKILSKNELAKNPFKTNYGWYSNSKLLSHKIKFNLLKFDDDQCALTLIDDDHWGKTNMHFKGKGDGKCKNVIWDIEDDTKEVQLKSTNFKFPCYCDVELFHDRNCKGIKYEHTLKVNKRYKYWGNPITVLKEKGNEKWRSNLSSLKYDCYAYKKEKRDYYK